VAYVNAKFEFFFYFSFFPIPGFVITAVTVVSGKKKAPLRLRVPE